MRVDVEDDDLRISYQPGAGRVAVVAFTGVGHQLGGIQSEEFRASLAQAGPAFVIFVTDKRRRWYNHGLAERITVAVNALVTRSATAATVTLGNSMGGFGAIAFAGRLRGCTAAIAFCPQSSVHPAVAPFETRWPEWTGEISRWDLPDATTHLVPHVSYDLFYGLNDAIDVQHADRFRARGLPNLRLHGVEAGGHEVARYLKARGRLADTLRELIGRAAAP
jgi:hypothetical protein